MDVHKLDYHAWNCSCSTPIDERVIDSDVCENSYAMFVNTFKYVCEKNPQYSVSINCSRE
jgi:hypothetical protein